MPGAWGTVTPASRHRDPSCAGTVPTGRAARAAPQDALVTDAACDAAGVERLQEALGELARDPEPVAELSQRDAPRASRQLHDRRLCRRERLLGERQVA